MKVRHIVIAAALVLSSGSAAFAQTTMQTRINTYRDNVRTCAETTSTFGERLRCRTNRGAATTAAIVAAPVKAVGAAISYKKGDDARLKCVFKRSTAGCPEPLATRIRN